MEHVVDLDTDDIFNYPWMYAVEVGQWYLSDEQAPKLREYLLRGGFLMVDDFHGTVRVGSLHGQHVARLSGPARGGNRE